MRPSFSKLSALLAPLGLALALTAPGPSARADQPTSLVDLERGPYEARFYTPAPGSAPRGLVVFGSGDGGWSYWEEAVCAHLAKRRFAVVGVDFRVYAQSHFAAAILRRDYLALVAELRRRNPGADGLPVFYGGWSMGAEHSFPASAEKTARPPGLRGLILVAPGARGRYGINFRDRMGITPTGPGTFGLRELAPLCADLRMAVFHGGLDPLDDLRWPENLALDLKRWTIPRVFHDFDGAGPAFLAALDDALLWLLQAPAPPEPASP